MNSTAILAQHDHRPFPLPEDPWIMRQSWHELLFAHWPLKPTLLRSLVPSCLELDLFEGQAWIGVVPFRMSNVAPRALPAVDALSCFPELNVRTYVTVGGIPGVYFFSLDAGNAVAVYLARTFFHLPYFKAVMMCERNNDIVSYQSRRVRPQEPRAELSATYRPISSAFTPSPGTLEHWLTERYCLYTTLHGYPYRCVIHHEPWSLQVAELDLQINTMVSASGIVLPDTSPLLHYAALQKVLAWPLRRVKG